jgi:hypothetical protein
MAMSVVRVPRDDRFDANPKLNPLPFSGVWQQSMQRYTYIVER